MGLEDQSPRSLARVLGLFEALAAADGGLTLTQLSTALDAECRRAEFVKGRQEGYAAAQAVWEITLEAERARAAELTTETAALAAFKVLGTAPGTEEA